MILGNAVDTGGTDNNATDAILVGSSPTGPYVCPITGVATKMTAKFLHSTAGSQKIRLVVYKDNAGAPGALHAVTQEVTLDSTNAGVATLIDFPFAGPVSFGPGKYWVGVWFGTVVTNNAIISKIAGTTAQRYNLTTTYSSSTNPPDPFPTPSSASGEYVVYVTVEPVAVPHRMPLGV